MTNKLRQKLEKHFGFRRFRPEQAPGNAYTSYAGYKAINAVNYTSGK